MIASSLWAEDAPLGNLEKSSFRIDEVVKIILDGSAKASEIRSQSEVNNRLVFVDAQNLRARREIPIKKVQREIVREAGVFYTVSRLNRRSKSRDDVSPRFWEEIALSPLRLAQSWSLAEAGEDLDEFLSRMRQAKGPLQNVDGDKIEATPLEGNGLRLNLSGWIVENKTRIKIESQWELKQIGKLTSEDLGKPLVQTAS